MSQAAENDNWRWADVPLFLRPGHPRWQQPWLPEEG